MPSAIRCFRLALVIFFAFVGMGLMFPSKVYACPETNVIEIIAVTPCVQSDFCGSVSNTCHKACGSAGSINPIYDRIVRFTYTDNTTCESTVIFKSLAACNSLPPDLTQQAEPSCVGTCNPSLAGVREGITINNTGPCTGGSYCTGGLVDHCPANYSTTGPGSWCEAWTCNWGSNCGTPSYACVPNPAGPYNSQATCNVSCPPTPTVTLTVNNTSSITVNKGEGYFLNWSTTNNPTNCTATGSWSWSLDSPPNNLSGGSQTDSKNQAGIHSYTLTCGNGAGSDTKSVAVTVRQTCPDYTSCSSCTSQPSCGWTGSQCKVGTGCGGPSDGSGVCPQWYWYDCLTNQCNAPACLTCSLSSSSCGPGTTFDSTTCRCVSTTCNTPLTCTIQSPAVCTSATSGRGTVSFSGCSAGYDRIEWFVDGLSKGSNVASSTGGSADLTTLSSNTTYNVSATAWSTRTDPNIDWSQRQTPAVPCGSTTLTTNCSTDPTTPPPPSALECLLCESNTWNAEGTWVNSGERNCNDYICPTYPHRCDQPPLQQAVVSANRNLSGSANYRMGEMCFKNDGTTTTTTTVIPPGTITGTFYIRSPGSTIDSPAPNTALANWDHLRYWISNTQGGLVCAVNDGSMCITGVNSLGAYSSGCDSPMSNQIIESSLNRVGLMLYSWPIYFRPIGYYIHQETYCSANCGTRCPAGYAGSCTTNADGSKTPWTGSEVCSNGDCCVEGRCEDDPGRAYNCRSAPKSTLRPFPNPNGWVNGFANSSNNISTCTPRAGDPRGYNPIVDVVFERLPILSGNVCLETPPVNGIKDGTDSNFQGALVNIQGPTSLTRVTSNADINYQIPLTAGSYSITVTGGNSTITSTNGPNNYFSSPALLTISQDTIANFCFNPVGAWLQTTGGSVHSNTRIRMPGGP